ncbi:MAG: PRC-barrel domain-containing protein [Pseudomonadota bacterium]|nr:PRC-barrel domain-containing protein [Pseudomonadota bacterium]
MIGAAVAQSAQPAPEQKPVQEPQAIQAQSTPSTATSAGATTASGTFISVQSPNQWLASDFRGTDVIGANDEKIGDVTDLLFDKDGKVVAYVVGVGGFLGIGAKDVALPPSAFQLVQGKDSNDFKLKLSMTKDQLKTAADFKSHKMLAAEQRRTTTGAGGPGGMAPRSPGALPGSTNR